MSKKGKIQSIENEILAAIDFIEKKMKKRTDLERICKLVVSDQNGLSKEDIVNVVSQMHKDEKLKLKWYGSGPASYKINKDCENMEGYNGKVKEYDNKRVEDDKDHTLQDSLIFSMMFARLSKDQFTVTELKKVGVRDWKTIHAE